MDGVVGMIVFWLSLFFGSATLLFCMVYSLILFQDLMVDHINPVELCDRVNAMVLPEYLGHALLSGLLLFRGYLAGAILNAPLVAFHAKRVKDRSYSLDSTRIFSQVETEKRTAEIKLGFYLVLFFYLMYCFITSLFDYGRR